MHVPRSRHASGWIACVNFAAGLLMAATCANVAAQGRGPFVGLGHLGGEDVGLDDGYTHFNAFLPLLSGDNFLMFSDSNLLLYNEQSDALGCNVGGGARYFSDAFNRIFGGYAYYDFRDRGAIDYDQIGFGAESLGAIFDGRINVNVPTNTHERLAASELFGGPSFGGPLGQNIVVGANNSEQAASILDLETGALLTANETTQIRAFVAPYGVFAHGINEWGARGRVELRLIDSAWINGFVQDDPVFGTTGGVTLEVRLGRRGAPSSYESVASRLGDPIQRRRHVAVRDIQQDILATQGGVPITVLHVDSNAAPGGTGGVNDPVDSLADASNQPHDVVFAHGGSLFNGEAMVITTDGQQFLAEGTTHTIVSDQGAILLPGVNPAGATPQIDGSPAAAVTLANGNTVSGFIINNAGAEAILSNGSNAATLLRDLTINAANADAIRLENQTGSVSLDNVAVSGAADNGVRFVNGSANVVVQNSSVDGAGIDGVAFEGFSGDVNITNMTIDDAAGFAVSLANSSTVFDFTGGHIQNSTGAVSVSGGNNTAVFATDIDVSGNVDPIGNLYFLQTDGTYDFTGSTVNVTDGSGLVVVQSDANFDFDDVTISGSSGRLVLQDNTGFFSFGDVDIMTNSTFTSASLDNSNFATFNSLSINNDAGAGLIIDNTDATIGGGRIVSTEGVAASISDSTINITFASVTANVAASTPITLTNTTGPGFAITGDGVTAGSGGLLELDFADTAVSLTNANNVDISFLDVLGSLKDAVVATNSTGLRFNEMSIDFVKRGFDINESHNVEITNNSIVTSGTAIDFGVSLRSSVGSGGQGYNVSNNVITGSDSNDGGSAGIYVENSSGPDVNVNIEGNNITINTVGAPPLPVPTGIKLLANNGDINLSGSSGAGNNTVSAVQSFFHTEAGGNVNGQIFVNGAAQP